MDCDECGSVLVSDEGYEAIGRCCKSSCKKYNIPVNLNVI